MDKKLIFNQEYKNIKEGFYTSSYFIKTKKIIEQFKKHNDTILQFSFFRDEPIVLCGVCEIIDILKKTLTPNELKQIEVYGYKDGDIIQPNTSVLFFKGPYQIFGKYENIFDGILSRRCSVATNCKEVLDLITTDQLIFMADRTENYNTQPYDGYAAYIAGVRHFVTDASVAFIKNKKEVTVSGTVPHALIQQFNGDIVAALKAYKALYKNSPLIALVDYHNDVIGEIKKLSKHFKKELYAIRIDTSHALVDRSLTKKKLHGVNPILVTLARKALNQCGMKNTKIIISSGLKTEDVKKYLKLNSPVDIYGIGSYLTRDSVHFTADLVYLDGKNEAKVGRKLSLPIEKLTKLTQYI